MSSEESNHSLIYNVTHWFMQCSVEPDQSSRRVALFLLHLFIFMVGLLENLLVLWVNWRRRHSANGVLFCVLNVCLSDTMMVVTLPFYMLETTVDKVWLWGRFLCRVTYLVYAVNFYSSTFFLALMTLERYLSLTRPSFPSLFPAVGRRRWWLCGGVWLLSLFLTLLENVHVQLVEWEEPGCFMYPESDFLAWYAAVSFLNFIFQFLIPTVVIVSCNLLISRAVRSAPNVQDPRDVWLVHVYSLVFVLCWLPYHLVMILCTLDDMFDFITNCDFYIGLIFTLDIVKALSLFHCVANPILYNFLSKSFRHDLINATVTYITKSVRIETAEARPDGGGRGGDSGTSQSDVSS